ncbi:uncharacterized protein LOC135153222 [Lytechinus pictus]|uniref:uncharacterized protein LOC135153222 n=1 Tax=Lytechinus pictus TaxID=7653 RepID=UPI0030B9CBA6
MMPYNTVFFILVFVFASFACLRVKMVSSLCSDGYDLNYTLPLFEQCNVKMMNGREVQTIPKLLPSSATKNCHERQHADILQGRRTCRVPDCLKKPCKHGWCEEIFIGFTCHCQPGYSGDYCEKRNGTTGGNYTDGMQGMGVKSIYETTRILEQQDVTTTEIMSTTDMPTTTSSFGQEKDSFSDLDYLYSSGDYWYDRDDPGGLEMFISCWNVTKKKADRMCANEYRDDMRPFFPTSERMLQTIVDALPETCAMGDSDRDYIWLWLHCQYPNHDLVNGTTYTILEMMKMITNWDCFADVGNVDPSLLEMCYSMFSNNIVTISNIEERCLQMKMSHVDGHFRYQFRGANCENDSAYAVCLKVDQ